MIELLAMFSINNLLKEFTDESSAILCSLQSILSHSVSIENYP